MNCERSRNDSFNFLPEIIRISMSEVTSDTNVSNLFRIELIFIWAITGFLGYFKRNVFKLSIILSLFSVVFSEEISLIRCLWFWVLIWSQSLRIQDGQVSARMEKPIEFKCKPSRYKYLWMMLSCIRKSITFFSLFVKMSMFFFALSLWIRALGNESVIFLQLDNFSRMKYFNSVRFFRILVFVVVFKMFLLLDVNIVWGCLESWFLF